MKNKMKVTTTIDKNDYTTQKIPSKRQQIITTKVSTLSYWHNYLQLRSYKIRLSAIFQVSWIGFGFVLGSLIYLFFLGDNPDPSRHNTSVNNQGNFDIYNNIEKEDIDSPTSTSGHVLPTNFLLVFDIIYMFTHFCLAIIYAVVRRRFEKKSWRKQQKTSLAQQQQQQQQQTKPEDQQHQRQGPSLNMLIQNRVTGRTLFSTLKCWNSVQIGLTLGHVSLLLLVRYLCSTNNDDHFQFYRPGIVAIIIGGVVSSQVVLFFAIFLCYDLITEIRVKLFGVDDKEYISNSYSFEEDNQNDIQVEEMV